LTDFVVCTTNSVQLPCLESCNFAKMIRTIVIPDQQNISICLPEEFVGKHVEVIAFSIEEADQINYSDKVMTHIASEQVLARDWSTKDEVAAWQDL